MLGRVRAARQFVHDVEEVISPLGNSSQINFRNELVLAVLMPARKDPDLSFDRVSRLTTDSLALRFFHEYYWFGVFGLHLAGLNY